jgi:hypothetical protein
MGGIFYIKIEIENSFRIFMKTFNNEVIIIL